MVPSSYSMVPRYPTAAAPSNAIMMRGEGGNSFIYEDNWNGENTIQTTQRPTIETPLWAQLDSGAPYYHPPPTQPEDPNQWMTNPPPAHTHMQSHSQSHVVGASWSSLGKLPPPPHLDPVGASLDPIFDAPPESPFTSYPASPIRHRQQHTEPAFTTAGPWGDLHTQSTDVSSTSSASDTPPSSLLHRTSLIHADAPIYIPPAAIVATPATHPTPTPQVSTRPTPTPAVTEKRACIPCRRMKLRCDEGQPCARCSKQGRECAYRPEAEVEAAKQRRIHGGSKSKRSAAALAARTQSASSTSPTSTSPLSSTNLAASLARFHSAVPTVLANAHMHHGSIISHKRPSPPPFDESQFPTPSAPPVENTATDELSGMLYSRSYLTVLTQVGFRDAVLQHHALLDGLSPPMSLASMIEWHTQVSLMLLQIADTLTVDDFQAFMTDGVTEEQFNSPLWLHSPLAPWARLATRPLHYAIVPNLAVLNDHLRPNPFSTSANFPHDPTTAQLRIELLPAAHVSFMRWQQQLGRMLQFQLQLKLARAARDNPSGTSPIPSDVEIDDLVLKCKGLCIARALQARPPIPAEHDQPFSTHASWCPLGVQLPEASDTPGATHEEGPKVKRTNTMNSVHTHATTSPPSPSTATQASSSSSALSSHHECICSISTPLQSRIYVNPQFEQFFGWRRIDVEHGMHREGFRYCRRLYPPATWEQVHRSASLQLLHLLDVLAEQLYRLTCPSWPIDLPVLPPRVPVFERPPRSSNAQRPCQTKRGDVLATNKGIEVMTSDGAHQPSAVIIKWKLLTEADFASTPNTNAPSNDTTQSQAAGKIAECCSH